MGLMISYIPDKTYSLLYQIFVMQFSVTVEFGYDNAL